MQVLNQIGFTSHPPSRNQRQRSCLSLYDLISPVTIITVLWIGLIYRNERLVFANSLRQCNWDKWENWPVGSKPHHLALIADPQLVDPHTYPGRPWPLSSLTVKYTDLYLRRVHRLLQRRLYPDTTIFLGDLFDGGREWSTGQSSSPEKRYRRYGESFWHNEYRRFSSIFFDTWREAGVVGRNDQASRRKIISNIPGNHDLGFASGIQEPVRKRFNAYFGDGNALWIIGNHTVVTLDTVSFSAKEEDEASESIWRPAQQFLDGYDALLHRTITRQSSLVTGQKTRGLLPHTVVQGADMSSTTTPRVNVRSESTYPTIFLSHVPLYRDKGTPCGPLREKWPPSRDAHGRYLEVDERNAIAVARGYQYQNVLSPEISKEITTKLGPISYAFSGDDHDYCEVVHLRYPSAGSGIRETTVKSISWAMGVRRPGIQLVSLWNIADQNPLLKQQDMREDTSRSHLCLLPDQLGIFLQYIILLGLTLAVMVVRAGCAVAKIGKPTSAAHAATLLPISRSSNIHEVIQGQSSSSAEGGDNSMIKRSRLVPPPAFDNKSRSPSPRPSTGYGLPMLHDKTSQPAQKSGVSEVAYYVPGSALFSAFISLFDKRQHRSSAGLALLISEFSLSLIKIALMVLPWYLWLLSYD